MSVDLFTFTDSADPDEMQHNAAFHLGLHCLQKYPFRVFPNTRGKMELSYGPAYKILALNSAY